MAGKQSLILAGMAVGAVYTVAVLWLGARWIEIDADAAAARLEFVLGWLLLPGLTLLAGVGRAAQARFFDRHVIDGAPPPRDSPLDIDLRYLRNTLEQVVLAAVGWSALALALPSSRLGVIPALALSFVFTRICFWVGYHRSGPARAFGFAGTFYPTVATYLWALVLWIGG